MSAVAQRTPPTSGKNAPILGCRRETSTQRSQRSRKMKRLQRRLAYAFLGDASNRSRLAPSRIFSNQRRSARYHEITIPLPAFGTAQQPRPIGDRHTGAVLRDLGGCLLDHRVGTGKERL